MLEQGLVEAAERLGEHLIASLFHQIAVQGEEVNQVQLVAVPAHEVLRLCGGQSLGGVERGVAGGLDVVRRQVRGASRQGRGFDGVEPQGVIAGRDCRQLGEAEAGCARSGIRGPLGQGGGVLQVPLGGVAPVGRLPQSAVDLGRRRVGRVEGRLLLGRRDPDGKKGFQLPAQARAGVRRQDAASGEHRGVEDEVVDVARVQFHVVAGAGRGVRVFVRRAARVVLEAFDLVRVERFDPGEIEVRADEGGIVRAAARAGSAVVAGRKQIEHPLQ